ncbi:MAG TPA: DAK2 domain-containing protein [Firmicutes bacterium]|nr:DAK2 domain-containing protein [Bacillota bacterium]
MIDIIDGSLFQRMVIHAAASIAAQKQIINELNVFPVPDGDTGTNLSLTIATAAAEARKKPAQSIGQAAATNAAALLRGARGNSGVILSLLFRGVSKALKEHDTADGQVLAAALNEGVGAAYKAVMKPAEGTILTVSRLAAQRAAAAAQEQNSAEYVLEAAIAEGESALADTIHQNPVLQKAGVVDAGGKGYLIILQGMLDELRGLPAPEVQDGDAQAQQRADFASFETGEITFGYCTEFICSRGNTKDPALLRSFLNGMGDSLVLVDDEEIIKVHVHTNHPGRVLEEALTYGALLTVKIENMREQHTQILEQSDQPAAPALAEKRYGVVAVCAGAGMASVFRDLGVDSVISGGQTMNPSTEDILREVERTPAEVVFVLPNNKNIILAAQQCVGLVEGKQIVVVPTRTVPQGVSAMLAMDPDASLEANVEAMQAAMDHVRTSEVTYAARDSDFDGVAIREGDYMALADGQLFGTAHALNELLERLALADSQQQADFINIFYGQDVPDGDARQVLALFQRLCPNAEVTLLSGGQPVYYYMISAE